MIHILIFKFAIYGFLWKIKFWLSCDGINGITFFTTATPTPRHWHQHHGPGWNPVDPLFVEKSGLQPHQACLIVRDWHVWKRSTHPSIQELDQFGDQTAWIMEWDSLGARDNPYWHHTKADSSCERGRMWTNSLLKVEDFAAIVNSSTENAKNYPLKPI